tara:strand:+ start:2991 stop:3143 length:153 start_codon:yes stop_codon:yes gene_type:complete
MDLQEEVRNLKEQVTILSNLLWEIKAELDRKKRRDTWKDYKKKDTWEDYK